MCSIMSWCSVKADLELFKAGFERTISRGPDASRIINTGAGLLGFHRLAIMGLTENGMQPFCSDKSFVVCNGEIYGFRPIKDKLTKKGYHFKSDCDCEILLPMYYEYGTEMFAMLDAEFAMILFDGDTNTWIAARDPIGIRPLFYGYDKNGDIIFASEAKNLLGLTEKIMPFPPGYYYKNHRFIRYRDVTDIASPCMDNTETVCAKIHDKLVDGIKKRLDSDAPLGFLLSGGLDSSLVCAVSARLLPYPIRTFAIGMSGDAIDLKYAREVADYIGSCHTEIIITKDDVIAALPEVIHTLATYDITTIRASIGMYLLCKAIHEKTDIRVLMTGEISDELFGYKYTDFAPSPEAFQNEAIKRIQELYMYDVLRADRCISVHSMEARVPFGDLDFVSYVMSVDPAKKVNIYNKGKYLLRRAFAGSYLPENILMREKAAFSDAVGHSMVDELKAYAESCYDDDTFHKKCAAYQIVPPFTKESLLYREIFEKYYPNQAHMIKDFWMPNPNWEGCCVTDPSARVLSNYGDSGI